MKNGKRCFVCLNKKGKKARRKKITFTKQSVLQKPKDDSILNFKGIEFWKYYLNIEREIRGEDLKHIPVRKEFFLLARSKTDKENYFISDLITENDILKLFDLAGTIDVKGNRIKEDKFEEEFNFIGLNSSLDNFKLFLFQNSNENIWNNKDMNYDNHQLVFYKNWNYWYLKFNGETEPWEHNQFQYKYFVDKRTKKEIKNFYFAFDTGPEKYKVLPDDIYETPYKPYTRKQYFKDLEKYEKEANELIKENKVKYWYLPLEYDYEEE